MYRCAVGLFAVVSAIIEWEDLEPIMTVMWSIGLQGKEPVRNHQISHKTLTGRNDGFVGHHVDGICVASAHNGQTGEGSKGRKYPLLFAKVETGQS